MLWLLIPSVGAFAVVLAARLRRKLRAAAADRDVELRRQRDAAARLRLIAARLAVATEVHDTVAHRLVDIHTLAGVAAHLGPGTRDNTLTDIKRISAQALADLRATLSVIPQRDDEAPLLTPGRPLRAIRYNNGIFDREQGRAREP